MRQIAIAVLVFFGSIFWYIFGGFWLPDTHQKEKDEPTENYL